MDTQVGPDGQPAVFDGGEWFSQDRRYVWGAEGWTPTGGSAQGLTLAHIGFAAVFVAVVAYAVYTMVTADFGSNIGYYLGAIAFFGVLFMTFVLVGRWGWWGSIIRVICVGLAILKIVTLIANPPPAPS